MQVQRRVSVLQRVVRSIHFVLHRFVELFHLFFPVTVIIRHYIVCITNLQNSPDPLHAAFELWRRNRLDGACLCSLP